MEQFNLEKYFENPSRKVVTRDGREVDIVKYDMKGTHFPILYVISNEDGSQEPCYCSKSGMCQFDNTQSSTDLFFADEEDELTEFEKELRYWIGQSLCNYENNGCVSDNMSDSINIYLKTASKKLLDLARKEIEKENSKFKPKFKVGDWVRAISSGNIFKILSVNDGLYRMLCYDGVEANYPIEEVEKDLAYWTIQDAEDGDVLAEHETIVLFKKIEGQNIRCYYTYHYLGFNPTFYVGTLQNKDPYYPATKEQRDLLLQKMKEVGYEWDAEKKELKMIEQKSAEWSEEDKEMLKDIISGLKAQKSLTFAHDNQGNAQMNARIDWLQSLPEKFVLEPKQEWSEEDEETLNIIANHIRNDGRYSSPILANKYADFILSIKPKNKWKPSEEQMKWLKDVIETVPMTCRQQLPLESLYNDLKKL